MSKGLRRTLIAGAALFALTMLLWLRLDAAKMGAHLHDEIARYSDISLEYKQASLSFIHGLGLRLDQVQLTHSQYSMQAGHMNISVRLLPLLLGKAEIDTLDIHDAVIAISPSALSLTSSSISSLPVEKIHLIRSEIRTTDGHELLQNLHLELRDIGVNRETLWEMQARQQQHVVSGHGRLLFRAGEISNGFGKLKLDRMPLDNIRPVLPESLRAWFEPGEGSFVSGSLALDITHQEVWSVFGEVEVDQDSSEVPMKLRGKLEHLDAGLFRWRDSFIHLSDQAVIGIDGECQQQACRTRLTAQNIPLRTWFPLLPPGISFQHGISGDTRLDADVSWKDGVWEGRASVDLKRGQIESTDYTFQLPVLHLQTSEMGGDRNSWRTSATLNAGGIEGGLGIEGIQRPDGSKSMHILASEVDAGLWQPMTNLLLMGLGAKPELKGRGKISGEIKLVQNKAGKNLDVMINATPAAVLYGSWLDKPAGLSASCKTRLAINAKGDLSRLDMQSCELAGSSFKRMQWLKRGGEEHLEVDSLYMHMDQLHNQRVMLPASLQGYHGLLVGSGSLRLREKGALNALSGLSGEWKLQNFGHDGWVVNGEVEAKNGRIQCERLQWTGQNLKAELKGEIDFSNRSGNVDVISGEVAPSAWSQIGGYLSSYTFKGRMENVNLNLLSNPWQGVEAGFLWQEGSLSLSRLTASAAGGRVIADKLQLTPVEETLKIDGKLKFKGLELQSIQGIVPLIAAETSGILHANLELHGTIPDLNPVSWHESNGDILIYNGTFTQQKRASTLSEKLGFSEPGTHVYTFDRLETRFRMRENLAELIRLDLMQGADHFEGRGKISLDGRIEAQMENKSKKQIWHIEGGWPFFSWQSVP